jgi:diaminopimelate decarboxylase
LTASDHALVERNGSLHVEAVSLADIANRYGTPCYVYSRAALTRAYEAWRAALADRHATVCYAVKANSNLAILDLFARLGSGFDIVSGGELARVIAAGGLASRTVFSGVGKSAAEMRFALEAGVRCFNVESAAEIERLNAVAGDVGRIAPIAFRVNPDVDPKTHPYISTGLKKNKFGVAIEDAFDLYQRARALPNLRIRGIACHIGSQLLDPEPIAEATGKVVRLADRLAAAGVDLEHLDLGGGLGIRYRDEAPPSVADYLAPMLRHLEGRREEICFEPGRSLVGNAGVLLTRIEYLKHGTEKNFAVIDAAMNDLARPALYDAYHGILPLTTRALQTARTYDVVGPVCESGDFLGQDRELAVEAGDLLAILSAGAYGMTMSSNYNTRPRAAEVMVDGAQTFEIRRRETVAELFSLESRLP